MAKSSGKPHVALSEYPHPAPEQIFTRGQLKHRTGASNKLFRFGLFRRAPARHIREGLLNCSPSVDDILLVIDGKRLRAKDPDD